MNHLLQAAINLQDYLHNNPHPTFDIPDHVWVPFEEAINYTQNAAPASISYDRNKDSYREGYLNGQTDLFKMIEKEMYAAQAGRPIHITVSNDSVLIDGPVCKHWKAGEECAFHPGHTHCSEESPCVSVRK